MELFNFNQNNDQNTQINLYDIIKCSENPKYQKQILNDLGKWKSYNPSYKK